MEREQERKREQQFSCPEIAELYAKRAGVKVGNKKFPSLTPQKEREEILWLLKTKELTNQERYRLKRRLKTMNVPKSLLRLRKLRQELLDFNTKIEEDEEKTRMRDD